MFNEKNKKKRGEIVNYRGFLMYVVPVVRFLSRVLAEIFTDFY